MEDQDQPEQQQPEQQDAPSDTSPETPDGDKPTDPPAPPQEMVTVEWRNVRFEVPKYRSEWDMNVQFELEDNRRMHGYLTLVGGGPAGVEAARWQLYAGGVRTNADMNEFTDHLNRVLAKECLDDKPPAADDDDQK